RAGRAAVTGVKSAAWTTAGPLLVVTISGLDNGIKYRIRGSAPPPCRRRLAGSSTADLRGSRAMLALPKAPWPRTPRNAPVPPVTIQVPPVDPDGAPGGAPPPF